MIYRDVGDGFSVGLLDQLLCGENDDEAWDLGYSILGRTLQ